MELSTIAKPYAQAIFEIAGQSKSVSNWSDFLAAASAIMADKTRRLSSLLQAKAKIKNLI